MFRTNNRHAALQALLSAIKFDDRGLVCAVAQDNESGRVLMQAWMNREALEKTAATGQAHYFSRSRNQLWLKGESSGHVQNVRDIRIDCDGDTVLLLVEQTAAACHEGYRSCFFRRLGPQGFVVEEDRLFDPDEVYKK